MPVHPCGGYSNQSLMNILEKYYKDQSKEGISTNFDKLYTIHRLDRLTSGLIILGKKSSIAQSYSKNIMNRSCQKIYLARVVGKFPLKYRTFKQVALNDISQSGMPLHGEWKEDVPDKIDSSKPDIARLRKQHALACWISDQNGEPVFQAEQDDDTNLLEKVFHSRHRYVSIFFL